MIRPIIRSPRRKKVKPSRYVDHHVERELPPVMKRRCQVCRAIFPCRDVLIEKCCQECTGRGLNP
jgi:hypothetical protein